jgi:hypothetical protein
MEISMREKRIAPRLGTDERKMMEGEYRNAVKRREESITANTNG